GTVEELEDAQLAHCAAVQRQSDRIRSTTRFHWWPKQIHKLRGPRWNRYQGSAVGGSAFAATVEGCAHAGSADATLSEAGGRSPSRMDCPGDDGTQRIQRQARAGSRRRQGKAAVFPAVLSVRQIELGLSSSSGGL